MPEDFETGLILWAGNEPENHYNHLHVEPPQQLSGEPSDWSPITQGLRAIIDALELAFGPYAYFTRATATTKWTHMGTFNRRKIAGSNTWSQHAYNNAIDIGPYYGIEQQRKFYEFLKRGTMYEEIAGFKFYDSDEWPHWADSSIRASIEAGVIRGKQIDQDDSSKRIYDPAAPLTRAEAAVLLERIGAYD